MKSREGTRSYRSPLRDEQAEQTRKRILDGLVDALTSDGLAEVSVPAVARTAGVSVATVYRHFKTKRDLLDALVLEYEKQIGGGDVVGPIESIDLWEPRFRDSFERYERMSPALRAAMLTAAGQEAREAMMPTRIGWVEQTLAPYTKRMSKKDRERLRDLFVVLTGSAVQRAFKDYLGRSGAEAADTVIWALKRLVGHDDPRGGKQ